MEPGSRWTGCSGKPGCGGPVWASPGGEVPALHPGHRLPLRVPALPHVEQRSGGPIPPLR